MKEENNGRSVNGRDFSSGWNCTPMNQALESNYLAAVAVGDRLLAIQAAAGDHLRLLLVKRTN
jgi:hypothetical protein